MFDPEVLPQIKEVVRTRAGAERKLLDELRDEVRSFAGDVRVIKPRSTTAVSLVASDGGNNRLVFDPFFVQLVRVVDSYGKQLCLDAVSPTTDTDELSRAQFDSGGRPLTALGRMMNELGVRTLHELSHMIHDAKMMKEAPYKVSPSWVLVYRDLCEWAVLFDRICYHTFATDTLLVRDGLLRSKLFRGELFIAWRKKIEEAIQRIYKQDRRRVFLVGVAKHSKVLARYRLAMAIESAFPVGEARYVRVPRKLEAKAYVWPEYARGTEAEEMGGEAPKFVIGDMYLVRFGNQSGDPVWAVDVFSPQSSQASEIFGYLLADAIDGFPVPFYPRCLQRAHEHAEVVDLDLDILQDEIFRAIRNMLPPGKQDVMDAVRLNPDPSGRRYE
ncbi:MAG: hypothetical protein L0338_39085 [Acidobacteria bacterium]|nr:hypothetical protein [Acidobacteriota bacterium]